MASQLGLKVEIMTRALVAYVDLAISEAADIVVADMKAHAPRRTGALANSIGKQKLGPLKYRVKAGGLATTKDGYDYAVGTEFGNHHVGAQPFFYNTYRVHKKEAKNNIRKAVHEGVRLAVR